MLELKNISKLYKNKNYMNQALNEINLSFRKNEFVSILGSSGAGKTTLLNIIGGLDKYTKGNMLINGNSTKKYNDSNWDAYRNMHVGFIFQNYNLIKHISVYKNVEIALTLSRVKDKKEKVMEVLKKVGLENFAYKKPNELSGGQMQRVAIARALVNNPDIILADEPTGALDSKTSIIIMNLIKEVSKDKLVIMVSHNEALAKKYSNRIIRIKDGKVISDSNPFISRNKESKINLKKTKMKFMDALILSFNNLKNKKSRTILTSLASSIGIIGIALILSISAGFKKQINDYEKDTASLFPISILEENKETKKDDNLDKNKDDGNNEIYIDETEDNIIKNSITSNYVKYIEKIDKKYLNSLSYKRITNFNLMTSNNIEYKNINQSDINFTELPNINNEKTYIKNNYKILCGSYPKNYDEIVLIINESNTIDKKLINALFISTNKNKVAFSELLGKELRIVKNDDYYKKISNDIFIKNEPSKTVYNKSNLSIKIVGILKEKKSDYINSVTSDGSYYKIGYKKELIDKIVLENKDSEIVKMQKTSDNIVFMGNASFDEVDINKEVALKMLGENSLPVSIHIYPNDFKSKNIIKKYLDSYNKGKLNKITYTDYAGSMINLTNNMMKSITIILIAFSSISLVVSSIMVGIITYISVLERTKEIGILRSLGARKKDIRRVFNAETFIIGNISGFVAIFISKILLKIINEVLYHFTGLKNIAILKLDKIVILLLLSIIITMLSGFISSKKASLKEPIEALKNE